MHCCLKMFVVVTSLTVSLLSGPAACSSKPQNQAKPGIKEAQPLSTVPAWAKNPPSDWFTFHLAHPGPGNAMPGDPNPAFYYKGRYHLHYIYNHMGACFAHVSSDDMVHWQWHPTVLRPANLGHGMFSGTGFFTKDGTPAMIYHGIGSGRNWIQYAVDDQLNRWSKPEPVIALTKDGNEPDFRQWDPDLWLMNDTYYAYSGGENPQLMKSADLKSWTYLGDLLHPDYPQYLSVPMDEDISCGNMFQIGDKWMLLCISHRLGARYYLGDFKDEKFLPETHHMMSFGSSHFFAPESLLARDGRRVMWAWIRRELPSGSLPDKPTGIQSLPRELELPEDGILRIKPLRELESLRYEPVSRNPFTLPKGGTVILHEISGDAFEMEVTFAWPISETCGIDLLADRHGNDGIRIVAGGDRDNLQINNIIVPFKLNQSEDLTLRLFVDKNLVEVFVNDRQAVAYAAPKIRKYPNLRLFSDDNNVVIKNLKAWKLKTIYIDR